jgi:putative ABC transport system permease protein
MKSYLKLALKVMRRRKFFTFISLFGISLTLVVLMVATAVMDNVFAPRAPESRFDRVLGVYRVDQKGPNSTMSTEPGYAFIERFVRTLSGVERVGAYSNMQSNPIYVGSNRIDVDVKRTDGDYWKILDFHFLEGRPFVSQEDGNGAHVAVITDTIRAKLFGAGSALGKKVDIDGSQFTVIGVVPHVSLTRLAAYSEIWTPIGTLPSSDYRHQMMGGFNAIVLAHSRADFPRIRREFAVKLRDFPLDHKEFTEVKTGLDTTFEAFARMLTWNRQGDRAPLIIRTIFISMALLFMVLPALNLITLNLSRILERASEIGVRKAFGAPRPSLVWQFVVENTVLTVIGGVIGFILSVAVLYAITKSELVPGTELDVNMRIFGYGMVIAVLFGLFSGVYPAWRMSRLDPVNALRGGGL